MVLGQGIRGVGVLSAIVMLIVLILPTRSYSQLAFDSACYYPQLGNPEDFDSIYGSYSYQHLGDGLWHLPPRKGEDYNSVVFFNYQENPKLLTQVKTGPDFNLHSLKVTQQLKMGSVRGYRWGHFRSPKYLDLLYDGEISSSEGSNPTIYWADENGDYDTSRFTQVPPFKYQGGGSAEYFRDAYIAHLTSDTVEDIVFCLVRPGVPNDSIYLAYVKGGQQLYDKGRTAFWDEAIFWAMADGNQRGTRFDSSYRGFTQGDFRGVGREDLLATSQSGITCYYRNDPPFSLQKLWDALHYDTLASVKEWSHYDKYLGISAGFPMRAFPKKKGDSSIDLLMQLPLDPTVDQDILNGICLFRGGPQFGTKRLSLDHPDYFIHCPGYYSPNFYQTDWPLILMNGGDLTGTGNPVLITDGGAVGVAFWAFYVLGAALNDKMDLFMPFTGGSEIDTITAGLSPRKSLIWSASGYETQKDRDHFVYEVGSIRLFTGLDKIPVGNYYHDTVAKVPPVQYGNSLELYPNPVLHRSLTLQLSSDTDQMITIIVWDVLGRESYRGSRSVVKGQQEIAVSLPQSVSAGTYFLEVDWSQGKTIKKFSVLE